MCDSSVTDIAPANICRLSVETMDAQVARAQTGLSLKTPLRAGSLFPELTTPLTVGYTDHLFVSLCLTTHVSCSLGVCARVCVLGMWAACLLYLRVRRSSVC